MEKSLLREIATKFLVPFFSGAELEPGSYSRSGGRRLVAFYKNHNSIAFKVSDEDKYRLILTRPQPFAAQNGEAVLPEIDVIRAFVDVLRPMRKDLTTELKDDLLAMFQRRIVAKALADNKAQESVLLSGIDHLLTWSTSQYEGLPVSSAIGFRYKRKMASKVTLAKLHEHGLAAVLSNGFDTLLEFDYSGRLITHTSLAFPENLPSFCPYRQTPIADWAAGDPPRQRRVAMCLNRVGDILILRDNQLLFARRASQWHFFTHDSVIKQMRTPHDPEIRRAVYETCLDASFARTGACIGVVNPKLAPDWKEVVVASDQLAQKSSDTARAISATIRGKKFHRLDRRLRQELVALDGATVISHTGEVLSAGAILKISAGSTGGGRTAAAKALGRLGLGIKVSQDGAIVGYRRGRMKRQTEIAFRVM